jgi:hypothetical protein
VIPLEKAAEMVALRQWFQLILCRTLIEKDKANRYLALPSLLLPPLSWSKASKMLDDARADVKIVVASNVSNPNTPNNQSHVVRFRVQSGILEKYLLFLYIDQAAHCFSSNRLEAAEP